MSNVEYGSIPPPPTGIQLDKMEKAASQLVSSPSKRSLRIAIVTENFLPKVDGVTRTLARLLEHLENEGHQALVCGPESGMTSYASAEVIGTRGIPLLGIYSGLSLNFIRPRFIRRLIEFKPDVIQFVDPIWLCAQCIPAVQYYLPDTPLLTSYHTNLAMYATLFGFPWLTSTMWNIQKNLHGRCSFTFCPSPSTSRMLTQQGFQNIRLWPRGVDSVLFNPAARDYNLRRSWGVEEVVTTLELDQPGLQPNLFPPPPPPPYTSKPTTNSSSNKIVLLYVGRISWEKNLRLLVEAVRGLQVASTDLSRPACQLVFVGEGPSKPELEALCSKYGLDAIFMGYRQGEELGKCYASSDLFLFPSVSETFGQVVSEALASGLPVVGLRSEGVCDLVKEGKTGLLLDLDDLLTPGSPEKVQSDFYKSDPSTTFRPLPENPHALVDVNSPTFPLAVSLYRSLIIELVVDHSRRKEMSSRASEDAGKRTWFSAMEMLVDGYRELSKPLPSSNLALSRTSTIEVISHCAEVDLVLVEGGGESTAASPRMKRLGVGRVLKLGGVFRRTGGRLKGVEMNGKRSWLGKKESTTTFDEQVQVRVQSNQVWATRWMIKLVLVSYIVYTLSVWMTQTEFVSTFFSPLLFLST